MAKKKKNKQKSKGKVADISPEWLGKSVEELKALVAGLESELESCRKVRNKAQVEHAALQSYYDVTKEESKELEMKIDEIDLEIENTEEENSTEMRVYKQKSNFIKYCHDNKIKSTIEDDNSNQKDCVANHERRMIELQTAKDKMLAEFGETELQQAREIVSLQAKIKQELMDERQGLESTISNFDLCSKKQHDQLKQELEMRGKAELDIITTRKESHVKDLVQTHEKTILEIKAYFEGIEREQQIDIEDLRAEIRKLKKAALHNSETRNRFGLSNEKCGKELNLCLQQVASLELKTKDMEKDLATLRNTNARLLATRKLVRQAKLKLSALEVVFQEVQEERNSLRDHLSEATTEACKENTKKKVLLEYKLDDQQKTNTIIERHLHHLMNSAGFDENKSNSLIAHLHDFIEGNNKEVEKLKVAIASAKKSYNDTLKSCREELLRMHVPIHMVEAIDALETNLSK